MKKIFTAASVEEARQAAAADFGVSEDQITFTVLEEPKKSLFGKLKGEAKVEAEYEAPAVAEEKPAEKETKDTGAKAEIAKNYMLSVLNAMGIEDAEITVSDTENGALFELSGTGLEELIGKKGELLDSLQYLSSLVCNKVDRDYFRISTDCAGFRARRKVQLEELAKKISATVKKTGRTSALEPMNPYERRIIHAAVSEIEGVTSRSTGEEPFRKVLISSTERKPRRDDFRGKGGKGGKGRRDRKPRAHYDITTSFEKDYKRPKPEDDLNAGLYGKIEF
ncbi:MAG: protein jag [Ruminococcus sp.]|nr:protein jag [Ruminococcus sp.]